MKRILRGIKYRFEWQHRTGKMSGGRTFRITRRWGRLWAVEIWTKRYYDTSDETYWDYSYWTRKDEVA